MKNIAYMESTVYKVEVDNKDILFFEDFIKRMSMKVLNKEEKDPTEMSKEEFKVMLANAEKTKIETEINTYSKDFAEKIRQARKERKRGETTKISSENLWEVVK